MIKRIACIQSCYIPWKGYLDIIRKTDLFIMYDCVQYTDRDWRNRNRIKTQHGLHWLTIPVQHTSRQQRISETLCPDDSWKQQHWQTIQHHYAKTPYFKQYGDKIRALYDTCTAQKLSEINLHFLQGLCDIMEITTPIKLLREPLLNEGDKTDKLIAVCTHHQATHYLSGPSAKDYLETTKFKEAGLQVQWMDYHHYREYPQLHPPFEHSVSVLDLLCNTGDSWQSTLTGQDSKESTNT